VFLTKAVQKNEEVHVPGPIFCSDTPNLLSHDHEEHAEANSSTGSRSAQANGEKVDVARAQKTRQTDSWDEHKKLAPRWPSLGSQFELDLFSIHQCVPNISYYCSEMFEKVPKTAHEISGLRVLLFSGL
jgi:hypothetical protein